MVTMAGLEIFERERGGGAASRENFFSPTVGPENERSGLAPPPKKKKKILQNIIFFCQNLSIESGGVTPQPLNSQRPK